MQGPTGHNSAEATTRGTAMAKCAWAREDVYNAQSEQNVNYRENAEEGEL